MDAATEKTDSVTRFKNERQSPISLLQCQRCKGFILSETSVSKRVHNVKCLSSTLVTMKDPLNKGNNCDIFQEFIRRSFPYASVKLMKLSDEKLRSARESSQFQIPSEPSSKSKNFVKRRVGRPRRRGGANWNDGLEVTNIIKKSKRSNIYSKATEEKKLVKGKSFKNDVRTNSSTGVFSELTDILCPNGENKRGRGRPRCSSERKRVENCCLSKAEVCQTNIRRRGPGRPRTSGARKVDTYYLNSGTPSKTNQYYIYAHRRGRSSKVRNAVTSSGPHKTIKVCSMISKKKRGPGRPRTVGGRDAVVPNKITKEVRCIKSKVKQLKNKFNASIQQNENQERRNTSPEDDRSDIRQVSGKQCDRPFRNTYWSRNGIDVSNVIEDSRRPRNSSLKAKEKFKEILEENYSGESEDGDTGNPHFVAMSRRERKRNVDDEDFETPDECVYPVEDNYNFSQQQLNKKKETRGRKRKYIIPLTNREKYIMFKYQMSLEQIRASNCDLTVAKYDRERGRVEDLTAQEKYYRYIKKTRCVICNDFVKAFYLEMHITHFHTEGHNMEDCDCILDHCKGIDEGKIAEEREKMRLYMATRTATEEKRKIKCIKCGRMIQERGMKNHLATHKENTIVKQCIKTIECIICHDHFSTYHGLKKHFVGFHMETTPFVCKFSGCKFKAGDYYGLERHVGKHLSANRIKCSRCGKYLTKLDALVRHKRKCTGVDNGRNNDYLLKNGQRFRVKRLKASAFLKESPTASHVKAETSIELNNIHLYDKIIETPDGPIHIKGETLDTFPEIVKFECESSGIDSSLAATEKVHRENSNNDDVMADSDEKSDENEKSDSGKDWDEARIRETVLNKLLSWNDKLQDMSYLNSLIRQDPLFQKLEIENPEFTKKIIRNGGRRSYFIVDRLKTSYRCNICSKAFRRSWALEKHKKQKTCHDIMKNDNHASCDEGDNEHKKNVEALICKNETDTTEATTTCNNSSSSSSSNDRTSLTFLCTLCGFGSATAKELETHMKASNHNKEIWTNKFHCPRKCGAIYSTIEQLNEHIDAIHLVVPKMACQQCPKMFANEMCLQKHVKFVHWKGPTFRCQKCGKRYRVKENCENHEKKCGSEERRPKCLQCNEQFCNSTSLRRHVRRVHIGNSDVNIDNSDLNVRTSQEDSLLAKSLHNDAAAKTSVAQSFNDNNHLMILGM